MWIATFRPLYCWSSSGDGVDWLRNSISSTWFVLICAFRSSLSLLLIGGFQSLSFRLEIVPSAVRRGTDRLLCCLIVSIHASGISIPLSLLMLSGWSLMWIASLTLRVYQCGSRRSINLTSSESGCSVYRKPTHTDQYLAYDSHHPQSQLSLLILFFWQRTHSWYIFYSILSNQYEQFKIAQSSSAIDIVPRISVHFWGTVARRHSNFSHFIIKLSIHFQTNDLL